MNIHALLTLLRRLRISLRAEPDKGVQVIHPQAHRHVMLSHQLPGQPPGHADIAVVIDNATEDVPGRAHVNSNR
ncbi:hypothetical protein D9M68_955280 [compost metagenome]